jgi:hypothetical protein
VNAATRRRIIDARHGRPGKRRHNVRRQLRLPLRVAVAAAFALRPAGDAAPGDLEGVVDLGPVTGAAAATGATTTVVAVTGPNKASATEDGEVSRSPAAAKTIYADTETWRQHDLS